ncbi:hypothetical protein RJT34_17427 [Clitoria ternatea]|uniref:Uncharacterized protein n=1 Tax=Clitoria ternatea TaxID=43366 RepID=A0AAN9JB48_CLITE
MDKLTLQHSIAIPLQRICILFSLSLPLYLSRLCISQRRRFATLSFALSVFCSQKGQISLRRFRNHFSFYRFVAFCVESNWDSKKSDLSA